MAAGSGEVAVEVIGVFEQETSLAGQVNRIPVLLLRDLAAREVRVPIGSCECLAIQIFLEHHAIARPYTHDLAIRLLEKLSARLESVVVDAVTGDTSHATLHLLAADGPKTMHARAGDAIALALRAETPVYVAEELLNDTGTDDPLS